MVWRVGFRPRVPEIGVGIQRETWRTLCHATWRPAVGIKFQVSDAELVTWAGAMLGFAYDATYPPLRADT